MKSLNSDEPIIQIIDMYKTGGAEKVYDLFSEWAVSQGIKSRRIVLVKSERKNIEYLLEGNSNSFVKKGIEQLAAVKKFSKIICNSKIKMVVSFCDRSNIVSILAVGKNKKYKVVATVHNPPAVQYQKLHCIIQKIVFAILRHFYNRKNVQVVAVSFAVKESLEKIGVKNIRTVLNPLVVDYKKQDEAVTECLTPGYFLFIGRLEEQKAVWKLVKAFYLYTKNPNSCGKDLVILGTGSQHNLLENLIHKLGLEKRIHILGYKQNVFPYIKKCSAVVFSSLYEGFPVTVLECIAMKKPFIGSDAAFPQEIKNSIENKEDFFYTTKDFKIQNEIAFSGTEFSDDEKNLSELLIHFDAPQKSELYRIQAEKNYCWFCKNCSVQNFKRYFE